MQTDQVIPPKVSIVMPVRNAAGTLPVVLESISNQTFGDWELIALDDGSKDETANLLATAARADSRVRVLSQEALGVARALQLGCAAARGEFIVRLDADDWSPPERLQSQLDFLECQPQIDVVSCLVRHGGDANAQAGYAIHVAWINSLLTPGEIALRRFVESPVAHPSVMFRRSVMEKFGGYREGNFPEDYELWLRWMDAGVQFGKVNAELLLWNDSPTRLSRTEKRYEPDAFYRTKCAYLARWLKRELDPSLEIWLWGAGRITRKRFQSLQTEGVSLSGFIDVDPNKQGRLRDGRPVVSPENLPSKDKAFILAGVSVRGARDLISAELNRLGRVEGKDYLLVA